ncbi:hypothetical protein EDB19DRAFT_1906245 [Suillus lakei]|nr:hypothetical protein EDB19DRAFT_1906245 [Suillus lakei]
MSDYLQVASTLCSSSIILIRVCDEVAQEILGCLNGTSAGDAVNDNPATPNSATDYLASSPCHESCYLPKNALPDSHKDSKEEPCPISPSQNSDTILVAHDDDSIQVKRILSDDVSDIKDLKSPADQHTFYETIARPARINAQHEIAVHIILPSTNTVTIDDHRSRSPKYRPLILVGKYRKTRTSTSSGLPLPGSAQPVDTKKRALTIRSSQSPASTLQLKPRIVDTKHSAPPRTALRRQSLSSLKQKFEPIASRLITVCDSIMRPLFGRHTVTVDHLEEAFEYLLVGQAAHVDSWIASMDDVGLRSMLTRHPRSLAGSPASLPTQVDAVSDPPGSRIKARIAFRRQQPLHSQRYLQQPPR